jgi:large subunit ribosomal protein L31
MLEKKTCYGYACDPKFIYAWTIFSIKDNTYSYKTKMKKEIHPEYTEIKVTCSCGNSFITKSTLGDDLSIEVCSACHPFYTGQQKIVDTAGRVDKFRKRFGIKE